jgi:hypothetical protein
MKLFALGGKHVLIRPACAPLWLLGGNDSLDPIRHAIGVMSDHSDKLEISACARGQFEACLEPEGI